MAHARSAWRALVLGSSAALAIGCAAPGPVARPGAAPPAPAPPPAVTYDTAPITRGTVKSVVACKGRLGLQRRVHVTAPGSGRVVEVHVDVGSRVKKGQVLARLAPEQVVLAPIDGLVLAREIEVGHAVVVGASSSPRLFSLASDTEMRIDAAVGEADVAKLVPGQHAVFTVPAHPRAMFEGTVAQIGATPRPSAGPGASYRVTLDVTTEGQRLRPGMTAHVTIEIAVRADVLVAPASALQFRARSDGPTVWTIAGAGAPTEVPVRIGIGDGTVVEIIDGVREGDRVVTGSR